LHKKRIKRHNHIVIYIYTALYKKNVWFGFRLGVVFNFIPWWFCMTELNFLTVSSFSKNNLLNWTNIYNAYVYVNCEICENVFSISMNFRAKRSIEYLCTNSLDFLNSVLKSGFILQLYFWTPKKPLDLLTHLTLIS